MAHYSVNVALEGGRLVARATRDFLSPVPAGALAIADGDEVLWLCESGALRLLFDESPFPSGAVQLDAPHGSATLPQTVADPEARPRRVYGYTVLVRSGERALAGRASLVVESATASTLSFTNRDGESLDRIQGEVRMATHTLELKKGVGKIDYAYTKDGTPVPDASKAVPYLMVKKYDTVSFLSNDGAIVVTFGNGSPFTDRAEVVWAVKGEKVQRTITDPVDKKIVGFKYSAVLVSDIADPTKVFLDDPHIIIDNTD